MLSLSARSLSDRTLADARAQGFAQAFQVDAIARVEYTSAMLQLSDQYGAHHGRPLIVGKCLVREASSQSFGDEPVTFQFSQGLPLELVSEVDNHSVKQLIDQGLFEEGFGLNTLQGQTLDVPVTLQGFAVNASVPVCYVGLHSGHVDVDALALPEPLASYFEPAKPYEHVEDMPVSHAHEGQRVDDNVFETNVKQPVAHEAAAFDVEATYDEALRKAREILLQGADGSVSSGEPSVAVDTPVGTSVPSTTPISETEEVGLPVDALHTPDTRARAPRHGVRHDDEVPFMRKAPSHDDETDVFDW